MPAVKRQIEGADALAVDQQVTAPVLVETGDQLAECRLAGAGVADDRECLPGRERQVESAQHGGVIVVSEGEIAELDIAPDPSRIVAGHLHDFRFGIDQGEDPLRGGEPLLELRPEGRDAGQRHPEEHDALEEQEPFAGGDVPGDRAAPAEIDQQDRAKPGDEEQGRKDRREDQALAQRHPV